MSNLSSFQIGIACLPFIGPWVSFYHVLTANSQHPIVEKLSKIKPHAIMAKAGFAALLGDQGQVKQCVQEVQADINARLSRCAKVRIYSIYGMIANGLTMATLISLYAAGKMELNSNRIAFLITHGTHLASMFYIEYKNRDLIQKLSYT